MSKKRRNSLINHNQTKICTKNQNSICCSICDEWVHQTCSNLTYNQFKTYCSPENADDLYECENCRLGEASSQYLGKLPCPSATALSTIDANDTNTLSPNSIFRDKDDIILSDYYTIDEVNLQIQASAEITILHINAVSLFENYDSIKSMIASLKPAPSILFILFYFILFYFI